MNQAGIRARMLALLDERSPATACPSEVARALAPDDWRPLMPAVRAVAAALAKAGRVEVTQRGATVDALAARGPIRLRLAKRRPRASPKRPRARPQRPRPR